MELKGMDKLLAAIRERQQTKAIKEIVKFHTGNMQSKAMREAPVDTGFLRRQIKMEIKDNGLTGVVRSGAEYAPYVEYGTRYMASRPHIRPAFYNTVWDFRDDLERLSK